MYIAFEKKDISLSAITLPLDDAMNDCYRSVSDIFTHQIQQSQTVIDAHDDLK